MIFRLWMEDPLECIFLCLNWLRVSGTAELTQIDQRVCQQLHPIVPPLDTFKAEQQSFEFVLPGKGPFDTRRCFRAVDFISDEEPKFIAIDEQTDHEIVHAFRLRKANRATDEPFDPGPEIDVLAFDLLRVLFADHVLCRVEMSLVRPPPIRIKPCDPKRLQEGLQLEKHLILPSSKDIRQYAPTVMIDRVPQPPRRRFLPHETPHLIQLRRQPATPRQLVSATDFHLHVFWAQVLHDRLIHLLERRFLFFNSFRTVVGLTCNTRAVSRIPLAFMAISTICCLTSGDWPA
jgi:hypothetical protein